MQRITGKTWQALLTSEPYGLHFSVSGRGRTPTDDEVGEAKLKFPQTVGFVEVVPSLRVNPYVRHYMSRETATRTRQRIVEHDGDD